MDKQEFVSKLKKYLHGETGKVVEVPCTIDVSEEDGKVRGVVDCPFEFDINELYEAYCHCIRPLTFSGLSAYISSKELSAALALLLSLDSHINAESHE